MMCRCNIGTGSQFLAAILILATPLPAMAQNSSTEDSRFSDSLRECQNIDSPSERLNCFDQAANSILTALENGDVRLVDREQLRETRRKLFGLSLPDLGIFKGSAKEAAGEDFDELETTITRVSGNHSAGYLIRTAEGAVWQITNPPSRLLTPKIGERLHIRGGALSSYFVRIGEQRGVKAKRIQ